MAYEVKDLLLLLWRRKIIISLAVLLVGICIYPLAVGLHTQSVEVYRSIQEGSYHKMSLISSITNPDYAVASAYITVKNNPHTSISLMSNKEYMNNIWQKTPYEYRVKNYSAVLQGAFIENEGHVNENNLQIAVDNEAFNNFFSDISTLYIDDENPLVVLNHDKAEQDFFDRFADVLTKEMESDISLIIESQETVQLHKILYIPIPSNLSLRELSQRILTLPQPPNTLSRVVGLAVVGTFCLLCFIFLIIDFCRPVVKSKEDIKNNYQDVIPLNASDFTAMHNELSKSAFFIKMKGTANNLLKKFDYIDKNQILQPDFIPTEQGQYVLFAGTCKTIHKKLQDDLKRIPQGSKIYVVLV